jgi:hypothetical protein
VALKKIFFLFLFPYFFSRLSGERHYYLVQLQTAVAFIDHMDAASLTMDPVYLFPLFFFISLSTIWMRRREP